ncbi:unnamed protein product [Sphenostylis stenocarpa]|uniref:TIR domain-containing protein n=1 Tax=Sphenostylis stenocarpa TaxID=92480 RepID=A0AA86VMS2_9FABA|nr:unnamed protein product [Sphenostylis stenocarpa]
MDSSLTIVMEFSHLEVLALLSDLPVNALQLQDLTQPKELCRVVIVVFTETYAESAWCLHELQQIIKWHETYCRHVLPVYYEIQPSDVRLQKSNFGKALKATAQQTFSGQEVEHALSRSDAELVDKVVKSVHHLPVLTATKFPVGLQSHVETLIQYIENTKVSIIGIWGIGGVGKTTIAKAVYNQIHDVLKTKVEVNSIEKGASSIQERLSWKRMLIVLNGANQFYPLKDLCGNRKWFGQGTVIIITTRDVSLLKELNVNYVYKINNMNENDSLELFSWHAFREDKPIEDFDELARNVVAYCEGLPLAIEVLGSYLSGKTNIEWKTVLSKLEIIPIGQVKEKLRISFEGLRDDMEKDIFLDVCCFFIGKDRDYVTEILNGCGLHADIGIAVLIQCCLLIVDKNNKLQMHPLVQDMGREIIHRSSTKERERRNRLFAGDAKFVLTKKNGTEAIQGLALKSPLPATSWLEISSFQNEQLLRLSDFDTLLYTGDYPNLSKQLRWICHHEFPFKHIPENCDMEGVIAIDLKCSNLRRVCKEPWVLRGLKFLNLSHSKYLTETPDFSGLPSLEKLILKDCPRLCNVHQSVGDLCSLLIMNLKDCINLSYLPREVYKLKSLKTLILSGCSKIDILEEDIVQMESLITLIAENKAVKQVPFSVVRSKCIGYISLHGFEGLSHNIFPSIIGFWMSPTMNLLSYINPFCVDMENNNWCDLAPLFSSLANLRSISVQCDTELQLSLQVKTIFVEYRVNFTELSLSKPHVRFSLIGVGRYNKSFNTLSDTISEGWPGSESCDVCLPGDNHPYWLTHVGEGHSVYFTMPQDSDVKGMVLCVVYLFSAEYLSMGTKCLTSILIVNYTKCTFQIHKHGTVISFNDIDWEGIISNLGSGDKVEIFVTLAHGLVVKSTAVYLICGQSEDVETWPEPKENALYKFIKKIF